jgi:hypothetical protein
MVFSFLPTTGPYFKRCEGERLPRPGQGKPYLLV